MDPMHLLALVCYYGPTPFVGLVGGYQALQCTVPSKLSDGRRRRTIRKNRVKNEPEM
jgi:hypothetical protein